MAFNALSFLRSLVAPEDQGGSAPPDDSTEVEGVVVTPTKKPRPEVLTAAPTVDANTQLLPGLGNVDLTPPAPRAPQSSVPSLLNYNNDDAIADLQAQVAKLSPQGGSSNPGVYGLLPEKMQHGTLRNILGALGDAFLVQSGHDATYGPRMDRQRIGLAMAGLNPDDPASVQAALQRVALTGAPGSIDLADKMQKDLTDVAMKKATLEQNQIYRQQMMSARSDASIQRLIPYIGGMVRMANTKEAYTAAYNRAEAMAQRIGPEYHASDFGLIAPEDWSPDAAVAAGLTSKDLLQSADKAAGRKTTERGQDIGASSRIQAAGIGAGARIRSAQIGADRASSAQILQGLIDKRNRGEQLTPAEQDVYNKMTALPTTKKSRGLPAGLTVKPPGGAAPKPAVKPAAAPKTMGYPVPRVSDVNYLRAHPEARPQFEAAFGKGSAKTYLGK